jgi:hypothetical protein
MIVAIGDVGAFGASPGAMWLSPPLSPPATSTSPDGNLIDEDTQWRKIELLVRTADRIWGR